MKTTIYETSPSSGGGRFTSGSRGNGGGGGGGGVGVSSRSVILTTFMKLWI